MIEAKERIIARQKAIDNDLMDCERDLMECERALKTLEKQEPTPVTPIHEARQQAGHKINLAKSVSATSPEDLANLHSFQHVNPEPKKKPYRIKTREEMLELAEFTDDSGQITPKHGFVFQSRMRKLFGRELNNNEPQMVEGWPVDTWMITENN